MLKIDKNLISTYLALNNKKADEYLAKIASGIFKEIERIDDNNQIAELLDALAEFVYKVPNQTIAIVEYVVSHPLDPKVIKSPFGEYKGKNYTEVIVKAVEIIDRIRYIHPDGVLPLLARLTLSDKKEISTKTQEVLKHFVKYDFNVLTKSKIGYGAQRKALDFVLAWTQEEQLRHVDFVETVLKELLSSSVEGTTSGLNDNADYTLTMHFGVVDPSNFLKKIRREVIDLTYELYKAAEDSKLKLKLVSIFDETSRTPSNVLYGDDVVQMIVNDLKYLASIYRRIIFGEKGKMTEHLGIVATIEERLYWINKSEKRRIEELEELRRDILQDELYKLFRLLVGDPITYREEEGWDEAESKRSKAIDARIEEINDSNLVEWINTLNKITEQIGLVAEWQFSPFRMFLRKLAIRKPDIASTILNDALDNNKPIKNLATNILDGFRDAGRLDLWDAVVEKIVEKQESNLVSAIIYSLNISREEVDLSKEIREQDLVLLEDIVRQTGRFVFLANQKENNLVLQYAIINTLTRNFKRDPARIETLILEMIRKNQGRKDFLIKELEFGIVRGEVDYSEFSRDGINLLKSSLVELDNLDWDAQGLLLNLGKKDVRIIFDVFWNRIEKDAKKRGGRKVFDELGRYQAIPYHFNDDLKKYLSTHPQFQVLIEEWLDKVTLTWSPYNWNISHFLKEMGNSLMVILKSMIERGDENSLTKAVQLMDRFEGGDIELGIEVIRRTKNKKNINHIEGMLFSTGIVSGEDGIARAYEAKAEILKKYLNDEKGQVKKFAERMIKNLKDSAKRERQRNEEEKQLRKIEFQE